MEGRGIEYARGLVRRLVVRTYMYALQIKDIVVVLVDLFRFRF